MNSMTRDTGNLDASKIGIGLDMKRICEEIQGEDSDNLSKGVSKTNLGIQKEPSKRHKKKDKDPYDLDDLKRRIKDRNYVQLLDKELQSVKSDGQSLVAFGPNLQKEPKRELKPVEATPPSSDPASRMSS